MRSLIEAVAELYEDAKPARFFQTHSKRQCGRVINSTVKADTLYYRIWKDNTVTSWFPEYAGEIVEVTDITDIPLTMLTTSEAMKLGHMVEFDEHSKPAIRTTDGLVQIIPASWVKE